MVLDAAYKNFSVNVKESLVQLAEQIVENISVDSQKEHLYGPNFIVRQKLEKMCECSTETHNFLRKKMYWHGTFSTSFLRERCVNLVFVTEVKF